MTSGKFWTHFYVDTKGEKMNNATLRDTIFQSLLLNMVELGERMSQVKDDLCDIKNIFYEMKNTYELIDNFDKLKTVFKEKENEEMFEEWFSGQIRGRASRDGMVNALFNDEFKELEETLKNSLTDTKGFYEKRKEIREKYFRMYG